MNLKTKEVSTLLKALLDQIPEENRDTLVNELRCVDEALNECRQRLHAVQKREIFVSSLPAIFHKLKNKLTPILGFSQILLMKTSDERQRKRIQKIEKNTEELTEQFNLLKEYLVMEPPGKEETHINDILSSMRPYLNAVEQGHKVTVQLNLSPDVPGDLLNPGQIEFLITLMVQNAVFAIEAKNKPSETADHTSTDTTTTIRTSTEPLKEKGFIEIRTTPGPTEDTYFLSIKDNGIGISEEIIPRIWTPFYGHFAGRAGLGLTFCENIINNHDASVTVRSQEGENCEFEILFQKPKDEEEDAGLEYFRSKQKQK